ncbi:MAG: tetratricopeptide repeat protein [Candidatus Zixiibacteriota bacterium]
MERAARLAPDYAEVLYDLACIRLGAGNKDGAIEAITKALALNPKLKQQAAVDNDLAGLKDNPVFEVLIK